jgi:hypothetical protein
MFAGVELEAEPERWRAIWADRREAILAVGKGEDLEGSREVVVL